MLESAVGARFKAEVLTFPLILPIWSVEYTSRFSVVIYQPSALQPGWFTT